MWSLDADYDGSSQDLLEACSRPAKNPNKMNAPWRTHSCVPRSHSCERLGFPYRTATVREPVTLVPYRTATVRSGDFSSLTEPRP